MKKFCQIPKPEVIFHATSALGLVGQVKKPEKCLRFDLFQDNVQDAPSNYALVATLIHSDEKKQFYEAKLSEQ